MSVRWSCPNGCAAVLGPTKARRDNIVRWCLACSAKAGKLVPRVALALEKKRAERAQARTDTKRRRAQKASERNDAYYTIEGVHLLHTMRWMVALQAFDGTHGGLAKDPPTIKVRRCSKRPKTKLASASPGRNLIRICAYPGQTYADVLESLMHELVHIHLGRHRTKKPGEQWHGERFKATFRRAAKEAWGIECELRSRFHNEITQKLLAMEPAVGRDKIIVPVALWLSGVQLPKIRSGLPMADFLSLPQVERKLVARGVLQP